MPRIRIERVIAADPTSAALLLAGPAAIELWPGLRRTGSGAGHLAAEATVPAWRSDAPVSVAVRALPPRRTPTAFVTRFEVTGEGVPDFRGLLTLEYAPLGTHAVLRLDFERCVPDGLRVGGALRDMASGFLANLAAAAEDRSYAA